MKKALLITGITLLVVAATLLWQFKSQNEKLPLFEPSEQSEPSKPEQKQKVQTQYDIPRTLRYSFTLKNTKIRLLKKAELWVFAPVKKTATQKVIRIETSHPSKITIDSLGNQILYFVFTNIPPYATQLVNITVELMLASSTNPIEEKHQDWFLTEEPFIEISHPAIQATAQKLGTVRHIFDWVAKHIQYSGYIRENRGALYAHQKKQGDCTEYMYLFTALARANGIPARGIGGYVYNDDAFLNPKDYHNWAEFYLDGKWLLADPQNKVFMDKQSEYIAMQIFSAHSKFANSSRFWFSGEGLSVKMNAM